MGWLFGKKKLNIKDNSIRMFNICQKRAMSIGRADYIQSNGKYSLLDVYRTDFLEFLLYLAMADGGIDDNEIEYINILFEAEFTKGSLMAIVNQRNLRFESFLNIPPKSLEAFVKSNNGPDTGELSSEYYDLISLYVTTFDYVGSDFIACNLDIRKEEIDALSAFMIMLRNSTDIAFSRLESKAPVIQYKPGQKLEVEERVLDTNEYADDPNERRILTYSDEASMARNNTYLDNQYVRGPHIRRDFDNNQFGSNTFENRQNNQIDYSNINNSNYNGQYNQDNNQYNGEQSGMPETDNLKPNNIRDIDLNKLMEDLNDLIGMDSVKKEVNSLVNLLKICKLRQEKGMQIPPMTNHLIFLGNPGTGKTTVARILSKIYHELGILSKGHLVEVDRSGLVAGYMGQTSEKVMEVVNNAKGGILFIDEAYALSSGKQDGDFGKEAIDILNKAMEDYRDDLIVIAAGYHDEMQDFLDANPGLRSRFNRTIEFPNYSADELIEIVERRAKKLDYQIADDALQYITDLFKRTLDNPPKNFGNARSVRNYLDNMISRQADRLVEEGCYDENELMLLKVQDAAETLA